MMEHASDQTIYRSTNDERRGVMVKDLVKWKRNQVFQAVEASGLSPESFDWDDGGEDIYLRYLPSVACFVVCGDPGSYVLRFVAGDEPVVERTVYSWESLMTRIEQWLGDVKRDTETPDLWAEVRRQTELLAAVGDESVDNTPFTPSEQEGIARRLENFRTQVNDAHALSEQKLRDLESAIEYLVDASRRLGRKDWLLVFIGATATGLATAIPSDASRHIVLTLLASILRFFPGFPELGNG